MEGSRRGPRGAYRPPYPARCPSLRFGTAAVCALPSGPLRAFPSGFLAGPSRPALATLRSGWAAPGPLRARRPAPGAPGGACGRPWPRRAAPWRVLRGISACGLGPALRGSAGCLASPLALSGWALRPSAPPPGSPSLRPAGRPVGPPGLLPPGGVRGGAALLRPAPGRGGLALCTFGLLDGDTRAAFF